MDNKAQMFEAIVLDTPAPYTGNDVAFAEDAAFALSALKAMTDHDGIESVQKKARRVGFYHGLGGVSNFASFACQCVVCQRNYVEGWNEGMKESGDGN